MAVSADRGNATKISKGAKPSVVGRPAGPSPAELAAAPLAPNAANPLAAKAAPPIDWAAELQTAHGDDEALLALARRKAAPLLTRLDAVAMLASEESLMQAEREFRSHDRRLHSLAKQRVQAQRAQREMRVQATRIIDAARALAGKARIPANSVVELDRAWAALDATLLEAEQRAIFAALAEQLSALILRPRQAQRLEQEAVPAGPLHFPVSCPDAAGNVWLWSSDRPAVVPRDQVETKHFKQTTAKCVFLNGKPVTLRSGKGAAGDMVNWSFVDLFDVEPIDRVEMIKRGVPAHLPGVIAGCMGLTKDRMYSVLGLPRATVERKVRNQKALTPEEGARVLGIGRLVGQAQKMVEESGNPEGFNAAEWVASWIERPIPALGDRRPAELMDTAEGQAIVAGLLSRAQSGAYS